ncbi:MAG: hypothetical protein ACI4TU_09320, partial [Candidatus Cryptobacteroides sp.]
DAEDERMGVLVHRIDKDTFVGWSQRLFLPHLKYIEYFLNNTKVRPSDRTLVLLLSNALLNLLHKIVIMRCWAFSLADRRGRILP